jgi:subtilisin family serine protease
VPIPSGPQTSFTARAGSVALSTYSIQSNPSSLSVVTTAATAVPACTGVTTISCTPAFSGSPYQITIHSSNGHADFVYTTDQTANGNHVVYFNQVADANLSIGSISPTSVTRAPQSAVESVPANMLRFPAASNAGRPVYSSTRVAVHYNSAALQSAGRQVQDVERFENATRAVDVGFARNGQVTRVVDVPSGTTADAFVTRLKSHAEVVGAEPLQLRYKTSSTPFLPNDTHFAQTDGTFPAQYEQWDMYRIGAPNAWAYSQGTPQTGNTPSPTTCSITVGNAPTPNPGTAGIAVAILDTGLDNHHADLTGGKVVYGEKVVHGVVTCGVAAAQDTDGHGTNVSGIAAANTNNGFGFAGVGFNVSLQIYKIFNDGSSSSLSADTGDEAQAVYDAVAHGARVINLSLGGGQSTGYDPVERDAIEYAISQNVAVVAAAGNETAATLDFPAGYDGVISVGATTLNDAPNYKVSTSATDAIASYSNYGPRLTVVAPGGDPPSCESASTPNCTGYTGIDALHWIYNIYTTTPFDTSQACSNINDCKALFAGTSQATPHVSGAVALLLSKNPALTVAQVTQILQSTADDISDSRQGHGRLNLYRAMAAVAGDNAPLPTPNGGLPLPTNLNFVAFAYTNSGGTRPTIINQTYTKGVTVSSAGNFRIADILAAAGTYHCAVWYDANGDGVVDPGDWFGVAAGTGSGSIPCTGTIVAHPVSAGFTLP